MLPSQVPRSLVSRVGIRLSGCGSERQAGRQAAVAAVRGASLASSFALWNCVYIKIDCTPFTSQISADIGYKLYGKAFNYLLQCMHEFIPLNHPIMELPCEPCWDFVSLSLDTQRERENHEDISHGHQGAVV